MAIEAALRRATIVGGLSVEREGCQPSYPSLADVESFIPRN
jgi:ribokinase